METKTEKPKVNVREIMERANAKTQAVKESTEKVEGKTKSFKVVPGFSKYEFNGIILRNIATKATGSTKYQINDDKGKSHNLSNDELKKMIPVEEPKAKKEPKAPRVKKENPVKVKKEEFYLDKEEEEIKVRDFSKKEILEGEFKNHKKHYMLHLKGNSFEEIEKLTGKPLPSIKRDIWRYQTGKTVL